MVTSKMLGAFREDARTRAEFLRFIDIAQRTPRDLTVVIGALPESAGSPSSRSARSRRV